jgi:hypothetical protein
MRAMPRVSAPRLPHILDFKTVQEPGHLKSGFRLATSRSLIGVMEAGFPILLANRDGERLTPLIVHFPAQGEPDWHPL